MASFEIGGYNNFLTLADGDDTVAGSPGGTIVQAGGGNNHIHLGGRKTWSRSATATTRFTPAATTIDPCRHRDIEG